MYIQMVVLSPLSSQILYPRLNHVSFQSVTMITTVTTVPKPAVLAVMEGRVITLTVTVMVPTVCLVTLSHSTVMTVCLRHEFRFFVSCCLFVCLFFFFLFFFCRLCLFVAVLFVCLFGWLAGWLAGWPDGWLIGFFCRVLFYSVENTRRFCADASVLKCRASADKLTLIEN